MVCKYIPVETAKETRRVCLDEILYIEKKKRQAVLITESGKTVFYLSLIHICGIQFDGRTSDTADSSSAPGDSCCTCLLYTSRCV